MRRHAPAARAAALAAVVALLALTPRPAAASPVDLFGLGARAQAMAGAVLGTTRGFEATYYNPAGLAFERRPSVALGFQSAGFDLEVNGEPLHPDHGYPCRLIAPNRPGVLQTKWIERVEVI